MSTFLINWMITAVAVGHKHIARVSLWIPMGWGKAFGWPQAVCPPKRLRPFAHYRAVRGSPMSVPLRCWEFTVSTCSEFCSLRELTVRSIRASSLFLFVRGGGVAPRKWVYLSLCFFLSIGWIQPKKTLRCHGIFQNWAKNAEKLGASPKKDKHKTQKQFSDGPCGTIVPRTNPHPS